MNILEGTIADIITKDNLSLVYIEIQEVRLTAIVIDTPESSDYLRRGNSIKVIFKETEVIIGKEKNYDISLQNRIPGKIEAIETGDLLSRILVQTDVGDINSVITSNAVRQLELKEGSPVTAMIKTNEIMLSQ